MKEGKGQSLYMYWYNAKTMSVEDTLLTSTDEEALEMRRGHINSGAFMTEYDKPRENGMGVKQAMIFVAHEVRLRHLKYQPVGQEASSTSENAPRANLKMVTSAPLAGQEATGLEARVSGMRWSR